MTELITLVKAESGNSLKEKLIILGIIVVFAMAVYIVMPKIFDRKLREYHEPSEIEDDEEENIIDEKPGDVNQGETK